MIYSVIRYIHTYIAPCNVVLACFVGCRPAVYLSSNHPIPVCISSTELIIARANLKVNQYNKKHMSKERYNTLKII